jgi:anti-sigma-K factor RskA
MANEEYTMKEPKDFYNDPQFTAYALGELEGEERAAVEALLQTDAAARAAVEAIRATARQLEAALAAEPEPEIISSPLKTRHVAPYATASKFVHFPYWLVGGLAAACFAVVLVLHESQVMRMEQQRKAAIVARIEAMEKADWADRERESKKSAAEAAEAKSTSYDEVTFPVAAIPMGKVEAQSQPQAVAADKTAAPGAAIASNQLADVETVKLQAFDVAAAPAHGYDASETTAGTRVNTEIAGVNNSVALSAPVSRAVTTDSNQSQPQVVAADKTAMLGAKMASNQPANEETIVIPKFQITSVDQHSRASETARMSTRAYYVGGESISVAQNPVSTFGLDVGKTSYVDVQEFLQAGKRPSADMVYIEELVNYFPYAYAAPRDHAPLAAALEVAAAPWAPTHRLVRIGLKAREIAAGGTRVTVAKDVKVQVEFNPAKVKSYRLIGYNDRSLKNKDFSKNVIPPAGDLETGRTVTALYEVVPVGVEPPENEETIKLQDFTCNNGAASRGYSVSVDKKAVQAGASAPNPPATPGVADRKRWKVEPEASNPELLTVKVNYTPIEGGAGRQLEFPLTDRGATFAEASMDFKFAAAVAGFGLILHDSPDKGGATLAAVEQWAGQGLGPDVGGYRAEFIGLVHQAEKLKE